MSKVNAMSKNVGINTVINPNVVNAAFIINIILLTILIRYHLLGLRSNTVCSIYAPSGNSRCRCRSRFSSN